MSAITVLKTGGEIIEHPQALEAFLDEFSALPGPKVLIHGGGRTATTLAARLGVETTMVDGRRITDQAMLDVVTMVYGGLVNKRLVAALQARGVNALGLTGADLGSILSEKRAVGAIDYGFVGDVRQVDTSLVEVLLEKGVTPVFAPLTHDGKGQLLNTNADTIASSVAEALARHNEVTLAFHFGLEGVLDRDGKLLPSINARTFQALCEDGTINGGMIPKLQNALHTLEKGVSLVKIGKTLITK